MLWEHIYQCKDKRIHYGYAIRWTIVAGYKYISCTHPNVRSGDTIEIKPLIIFIQLNDKFSTTTFRIWYLHTIRYNTISNPQCEGERIRSGSEFRWITYIMGTILTIGAYDKTIMANQNISKNYNSSSKKIAAHKNKK